MVFIIFLVKFCA